MHIIGFWKLEQISEVGGLQGGGGLQRLHCSMLRVSVLYTALACTYVLTTKINSITFFVLQVDPKELREQYLSSFPWHLFGSSSSLP